MTSIDLLPLETLGMAIKVGVLKLKGPDKNKHLLEDRNSLGLLKVYVRVYTTLV